MKTETVNEKDPKKVQEIIKCSSCDRTLKNSSEGIRSRKRVMCVSCYESLLNPFPGCCNWGALI